MSNEKVSFIERHEPPLKDGEYTIEVTQDVSLLGDESGGLPTNLTETISKTIYVAGERYAITQKNIFKQFPPPNNTGNYSNVLPHVVLTRSTLPWERSTGVTGNPWMYLFVYDDDDIENGHVKKLKSSLSTLNQVFEISSDANIDQPSATIPLVPEPGDQSAEDVLATTALDVIQIDLDWLHTNEIFPTDELQLLTSVRKNDINGVDTEHAICMANRMPKRDVKSYACLLSLEGRLTSVDGKPAYQEQGVTEGFTSFVSLAQWSFTCLDNNCYQINSKSREKFNKGIKLPTAWQTPDKAKSILNKTYTDSATLLTALNTVFGSLPANFSGDTTQIEGCFKDGTGFKVTVPGLTKLASLSFPLSSDLTQAIESVSLLGLFTSQSAFETALTDALKHAATTEYTANIAAIAACFEVPDRTFQGLLQNLSSASFSCDTLDNPSSSAQVSTANEYLSSGAIPISHHLQDGEKTLSWYHGPLKPNKQQSTEALPELIQSSDQLLRFDDQLNMLDVSYAAAWELGRLMTLNNKSIAMDLYTWRRQQTWKANRAGSKASSIINPEEEHKSELKEEAAILAWTTKLVQLKNIPFNYLVSDEKMLPKESIRFFSLDQLWIDCLLEGALSIGRNSNADGTDLKIFQPITTNYNGFILQSEVVSGWPHLEVSAQDASNSALPLVTKTTLGPDIALYLFEGEINEVDIHLKPESLHFGFDVSYSGITPNYTKPIRFQFSTDGSVTSLPTPYKSVPIAWKNPLAAGNPAYKVVDIDALNTALQTKSGSTDTFTSAQFAMEMIEGVPNVLFKNNGSKEGTINHLSNDSSAITSPNKETDLEDTLGASPPEQQYHRNSATEDLTNIDKTTAPESLQPPDSPIAENVDSGVTKKKDLLKDVKETDAETGKVAKKENPSPPDSPLTEDVDSGAAKKTNQHTDVVKTDKVAEEVPKPTDGKTGHLAKEVVDDAKDVVSDIHLKKPHIEPVHEPKAVSELTHKIEQNPIFNMDSPHVRKTWVIVTLALLGLSTLIWIVSSFIDKEKSTPLIFHFEGVKSMEEIEFVRQEYDEIIPISTKDGKLEFMLTAPASVVGKMDMTQMKYQILQDSLIQVTLPEVIISDIEINMDDVQDYYNKGRSLSLFLSGGGKDYTKAYTQIISALEEARKGVLASAIRNNIISETDRQARAYMINMGETLGYRIEFLERKKSKSLEQDIRHRLGGDLWRKVKHKFGEDENPAEKKVDKVTSESKADNTKKRKFL